MEKISFYDTPEFKDVLLIVEKSYSELRYRNPKLQGQALRDSFSRIIENVYQKHIPFDSFRTLFDSLQDFKSKVSKALKSKKKRPKQKSENLDFNWKAFLEH